MAVATSRVDSAAVVQAAGKSGKTGTSTETSYWLLALGLLALGIVAAYVLQREHWQVAPIALRSGISVFAALYVGAQLIERLLVPIAPWASATSVSAGNSAPPKPPESGGTNTRKSGHVTKQQAAAALSAWNAVSRAPVSAPYAGQTQEQSATTQAQNTATWAELLDQAKKNGNTTLWAFGSALGMTLCAVGNIHLVRLLATHWRYPLADIIVTGLVLGGGSKNLHDFITNLQDSGGNGGGSKTA